jgi:DNA-binding response OmpR family regulator
MAREAPVIMMVDDDLDFLDMNRAVLQGKGYKVLCFSDAHTAFEEMGRARPHLVVTDLVMKTLDSGFSLARQIRGDERFNEVPIIIVTAIGSRQGFDFNPRTPEELAAMRADAYFDKPVDPDVLVAKVEELLARPAQEGTK